MINRNRRALNLIGVLAVLALLTLVAFAPAAKADTIRLNGFPMTITVCGSEPARSQDAGGRLLFFCESTGKVELTIEHCTRGQVSRSSGLTTYSCNEERSPTLTPRKP